MPGSLRPPLPTQPPPQWYCYIAKSKNICIVQPGIPTAWFTRLNRPIVYPSSFAPRTASAKDFFTRFKTPRPVTLLAGIYFNKLWCHPGCARVFGRDEYVPRRVYLTVINTAHMVFYLLQYNVQHVISLHIGEYLRPTRCVDAPCV